MSPATIEKDLPVAMFNTGDAMRPKLESKRLLPIIETPFGALFRKPNALTGAEVRTSPPPKFALNLPATDKVQVIGCGHGNGTAHIQLRVPPKQHPCRIHEKEICSLKARHL